MPAFDLRSTSRLEHDSAVVAAVERGTVVMRVNTISRAELATAMRHTGFGMSQEHREKAEEKKGEMVSGNDPMQERYWFAVQEPPTILHEEQYDSLYDPVGIPATQGRVCSIAAWSKRSVKDSSTRHGGYRPCSTCTCIGNRP